MSSRPSETLCRRLFAVEDGVLKIGDQRVSDIAATAGTPVYVYNAATIRAAVGSLRDALDGFADIYYSVKANPNPAVVRILTGETDGLEVASGQEFLVALEAGCRPEHIFFAGPAKGESELELAIRHGVGEIHIENREEIGLVGAIARRLGSRVNVGIRVNPLPSVEGGAMRMGGKPTPFGFDEESLGEIISIVSEEETLDLVGIHIFAGTQILDSRLLLAQWRHGIELAARVALLLRRPLRNIDLGGGLGIPYHHADVTLDLALLSGGLPEIRQAWKQHVGLREARIVVEPGRFLVGEAGVYLMRVRSVKMSRGQRFVVVDGGMHHHLAASGNLGQVVKRDFPIVAATRLNEPSVGPAVIAGPLCTPLDTLGRSVPLPDVKPGDLIAILQSGAYGLTASPLRFLSHPLAAEVVINDRREANAETTRGPEDLEEVQFASTMPSLPS